MACYSGQQIIAAAETAGFSPQSAQQIASVMLGESSGCPSTSCAGARNIGDPPIDATPAQLNAMGLTAHCGLLQWAQDLFPQLYQTPNCLGNLQCELQAAYQASCGGQFNQPTPWGPHFGQGYGGCPITSLSGSSSMPQATTFGGPPIPCVPGTPFEIPGITCNTNNSVIGKSGANGCSITNLSACGNAIVTAGKTVSVFVAALGLLFVGLLILGFS